MRSRWRDRVAWSRPRRCWVGLDALVTADVAAYEATALALATSERERLVALRRQLAAALPASPLFDAAAFTRDFERLYKAMHDRRRGGLATEALVLTDAG